MQGLHNRARSYCKDCGGSGTTNGALGAKVVVVVVYVGTTECAMSARIVVVVLYARAQQTALSVQGLWWWWYMSPTCKEWGVSSFCEHVADCATL